MEEFKKNGAKVSGFRKRRRRLAKEIQPGDYLLCYMTGVMRFIGVLEVKSECYEDDTPIWEDTVFQLRFDVELVYELTPGTAVPVLSLKNLERESFSNDYCPRLRGAFGAMELPYVLVAEHGRFKDRAVVMKGLVLLQRPHIVLPPHYGGSEFTEGFEHANAIPPEAVHLLRAMQMPYSRITNKLIAEEEMEYGSLQSVLDRFNKEMENQEDIETGLIKGVHNGADISLMRYSLGLAIKSAPGNVKEFFEHLRRRRGEPIRPDERITDEDIRRLFG